MIFGLVPKGLTGLSANGYVREAVVLDLQFDVYQDAANMEIL
jgi:hypothetical protein